MSNAGYFGKSEIQISGEEYQLCRPTLFLTGLLLYVNKEPHPPRTPEGPTLQAPIDINRKPKPQKTIEDPNP